MNWDWFWNKVDEMIASWARPYQMFICSTSLALSLPLAIYLRAGELVVSALAAAVAGVAGGTAVLRTIDIKTKAKAATEDKRTATAGVAPVVPIKTEEVS